MDRTERHARRYGSKGAFLGTKQAEEKPAKSTTNVSMTKSKKKQD